jgi:hypothetical protein
MVGVDDKTVKTRISEKSNELEFCEPPGATNKEPWGNVQHF